MHNPPKKFRGWIAFQLITWGYNSTDNQNQKDALGKNKYIPHEHKYKNSSI